MLLYLTFIKRSKKKKNEILIPWQKGHNFIPVTSESFIKPLPERVRSSQTIIGHCFRRFSDQKLQQLQQEKSSIRIYTQKTRHHKKIRIMTKKSKTNNKSTQINVDKYYKKKNLEDLIGFQDQLNLTTSPTT